MQLLKNDQVYSEENIDKVIANKDKHLNEVIAVIENASDNISKITTPAEINQLLASLVVLSQWKAHEAESAMVKLCYVLDEPSCK